MCHIVSSSPNVRKRHTAINANSPPALLAAPWSPSGPADASGEIIIIFAFDAFLEMSARQVAWPSEGTKGTLSSPLLDTLAQ